MGSRLSRQDSLNGEVHFSKNRPQRHGTCGEDVVAANRGGGNFSLSSLIRRSDKLPRMLRKTTQCPYMRRVAWIREIQTLLRVNKVEQAGDILRLLRKDMGLEGTSLTDILYKNAAFLNLVDPISHELLLSLARDMQCPKMDAEPMKSSEKICRQLIYHLTPHSKWARQGTLRKKPQTCLKTMLQKKLSSGTVDLSGIALSSQDIHRVTYYLQKNRDGLVLVDLSFTELQDDGLRPLLPFLGALPKLSTLALNGNRLTAAVLKDLTEVAKDPSRFPSLAWVDLGNNVDILTIPQPLLVALRRRFGLKSSLPTIYEHGERRHHDWQVGYGEEEEEEENVSDMSEEALEDKPELWEVRENMPQDMELHCCER
ncbi:leucine-rich repeat-containing protein 75B-like isoform X1 [Paramormyrops kingsleyae]|uniref:leucine-rich repeat-containing protein 75B-like isoform X1 n=1 Tax=Paramormyrops kingsleyae TaxID=1676925 RepID=UPI003B96E5C9